MLFYYPILTKKISVCKLSAEWTHLSVTAFTVLQTSSELGHLQYYKPLSVKAFTVLRTPSELGHLQYYKPLSVKVFTGLQSRLTVSHLCLICM